MTQSKKTIKNLEEDLQRALNADAIRDYTFFGGTNSIYRPYIIVNLNKNTTTRIKQKIIEYIYETYANIHSVELVNQKSCLCIDFEREDSE
jgi:hypothetical protein